MVMLARLDLFLGGAFGNIYDGNEIKKKKTWLYNNMTSSNLFKINLKVGKPYGFNIHKKSTWHFVII
jgi:hypothetical protein